VVSPRPGRLVIFDGSIPHAGRPPSRICHAPRYTLAYKFDIVD
jgi:SM-20-related protein